MKKTIIMALCAITFLVGCEEKQENPNENHSFVDIEWTRDSGHDLETLRLNSDGSYSYTCACGNPINDADLCESYKYEGNEIKLDCFETTEEMVTTIKVIKVTENTLELDFNGETRIFEKNN